MSGAGLAVSPSECVGWPEVVASIRRTFRDHIPLYACAAAFCAATAAVVAAYHLPVPLEAASFFLGLVGKFLVLGVALAALGQLVSLIRAGSPERPLQAIARRLAAQSLSGDRAGNAVHSILALTPLMICFASMKSVIPQIRAFDWDRTFMAWDRVLGLGHLPWELLQPLLGHPAITAALNASYDAWFLIMFGSLFWQAFSAERSRTRMQYLLAFAFAWFIAGNVLATALSSAGPCFYGYLHPAANPYAAQMAYLHGVGAHWPVWSLQLQDMLWQSYQTGTGDVAGISAMPSMHVTSTVLIALLCTRVDRRLAVAAWIYTALIMLGSVHLAWHYGVNSIAGAGLAIIFWYGAGWVLHRTEPVPAARAA